MGPSPNLFLYNTVWHNLLKVRFHPKNCVIYTWPEEKEIELLLHYPTLFEQCQTPILRFGGIPRGIVTEMEILVESW